MAKVTIYLPDELEKRVREAGLSMSPICQTALEEEARKMEARVAATEDVEKVATRLRATVAEDEKAEYERGLVDGREWARDLATLSELEDIVDIGREHWISFSYPEGHSLVLFLTEREGIPGSADEMRFDRDRYTEGLIDGASEVYEAVEPHI